MDVKPTIFRMIRNHPCTLGVIFVVVGGAGAATIDDISFRASFDESPGAELADGRPTPSQVNGDLRYEPGRFGQALVGGENGTIAEYRIESNLDVKRGA